jgi:RNA polymerase sigma-70 factor, ECF subfamily
MRTERPPLASSPPVLDTKAELMGALPKLRGLAISLNRRYDGRSEGADDLVQETVTKALANIHSFTPGSNMMGWLYTILRHEFYSEHRRYRREVQDEDGYHAAKMESRPVQEGHMQFLELRDAMARLRPEHREALMLVGASGLSYEDAARICACMVGTMKSRVSRARGRLTRLLAEPKQYQEPHVA